MIFPIGDDNIEGGHKPLVAYSLIIINLIVFIIEINLGETFIYKYAATPEDIVHGNNLHTLGTSMFMHGGIMHLLGNMLYLWIFADNIEAIIGSIGFTVFYLLGGLFASAMHIITDPHSIIPTLGASGAISAVMGAYLIMFPKSRVKMIILIFFKKFHIPALLFLLFWFAQQLFMGVGNLSPAKAGEGGIAWWAHIGGFAFGMLAGYIIKKTYGDRYSYTKPIA
ncbi:MAG: rhomboid family intramembrane serine protease [Bacteroidia bacterium]|nr:rhomboid family intramembrane serine protease [Bacteroidia bacterium]